MTAEFVHIVDDNKAVRASAAALFEASGLATRTYPSGEAFLREWQPGQHGCLVLDLRMKGMSGADLHARLADAGCRLPVIFLTGHGTVPVSVQMMKNGAVDFLTKPLAPEVLVSRVRAALAQDREARARAEAIELRRRQLAKLTPQELRVLGFAMNGLGNKEIARALSISHRTVEVHRSRILQKTQQRSVAQVARLAAELGLIRADEGRA